MNERRWGRFKGKGRRKESVFEIIYSIKFKPIRLKIGKGVG